MKAMLETQQRNRRPKPPITLGGHRLLSLYRQNSIPITLVKVPRGFGGSAPKQER